MNDREPKPILVAIDVISNMADQLDRWAKESIIGGWSTHQVEPMFRKADELRRFVDVAKHWGDKW